MKGSRACPSPNSPNAPASVLYTQPAETGTAPTAEALADAMAELAVLAHPFATRSFRFSVMGPRTLWWGGCAWDAFAIPNLVTDSPPVFVATTCPACATPHAWTVTNQAPPAGEQVAHFLVAADRIWPDAARACENRQIFCSEACVADRLERTGNDRGYGMSLSTLWRLAEHWVRRPASTAPTNDATPPGRPSTSASDGAGRVPR